MKIVVLVGMDPSYKRTGIAVYRDGIIYVNESKTEADPNKSFEQVYADAKSQSTRVVEKIREMSGGDNNVVVMSECPPPQGSFSPGLWGLDCMLFQKIQNENWELYRLYPTFIMHVHGKRDFKKSESVVLAKKILDQYKTEIISKRLSHDESEAVIFLARNMARHGVLKEEILNQIRGLADEKEAILCNMTEIDSHNL